MLTPEDKEYLAELHKLLEQRFEVRLSAIERELNQYRKVALSNEQSEKLVEEAKKIFRAETLRINTWTRISIAVIAALAVIGNGTSNVIVDHTESKAMARYALMTDEKLSTYKTQLGQSNRDLIQEVRAAVAERDMHLETLIVKGAR